MDGIPEEGRPEPREERTPESLEGFVEDIREGEMAAVSKEKTQENPKKRKRDNPTDRTREIPEVGDDAGESRKGVVPMSGRHASRSSSHSMDSKKPMRPNTSTTS
jgi:hypothetical protein